ncbi:MAG: gamma-glutamylcyclotransferase [Chroococcidiopsidaceae cyanobacterium CP_BM_RX_35]|nr:gamma-glutamylcyclotransferase [Chroococcidiopsidaceae cyanobacterium CP_BM_RX_35]
MTESHNLVKVFVYGTLKPGEANYQRYCAGLVIETQRAITFGQLFALPFGYPAMTLGDHLIYGFLFSFSDAAVLHHLDWLEDYNPKRPATQNEYIRQQMEIYSLEMLPLGSAWVYLMTLERIHSYEGLLLPNGWWSSCRQYLPNQDN